MSTAFGFIMIPPIQRVNLDTSRGFAMKMDFVAPDRANLYRVACYEAPRLSVEEAVRRYG